MEDKQAYRNSGCINDRIKMLIIVAVTAILVSILLLNEVNAQTDNGLNTMLSDSFIRGDLNGNGISADAGDLVLMKRASIGEIQPDSRYDLNNNGQFADVGDLVLMSEFQLGK